MKTSKKNTKVAKKSTIKNKNNNNNDERLKLCVECKKVDGRKYQSRLSPHCHAADCPNQMLKGNDKRIYISTPDANGTYKWQPMTTNTKIKTQNKSRTYFTHDNGSRPFKVTIIGRTIDIYEAKYPDLSLPDKYRDLVYYEYRRTYQVPLKGKIFIGTDPENIYEWRPEHFKAWIGNSILAELDTGRYLFIGDAVFEFQTANNKSGITLFRSPVGNNDVPYPFAMDNEYVYLLIEYVRVAKNNINLTQKPFDPYSQYYNHNPEHKIVRRLPSEKLEHNVIIPRQ